MPSQWSHSMFWEQKVAIAADRDFLLVGVGRGAVTALALIVQFPENLAWLQIALITILLLPMAVFELKGEIIKALGGEDKAFLAWINSPDGQIVRSAVSQATTDYGANPRALNTMLDNAYSKAQAKGCQLSGWELRLAIYYWLGNKLRKW